MKAPPTLPRKYFVSCSDLNPKVICCDSCHDDHEDGYYNLLDRTSRTTSTFCCALRVSQDDAATERIKDTNDGT